MRRIDLSVQAADALGRMPKKHAAQIVTRIDKLAADPDSLPSIAIQGATGYRRIRSGEYRVAYKLGPDAIFIGFI